VLLYLVHGGHRHPASVLLLRQVEQGYDSRLQRASGCRTATAPPAAARLLVVGRVPLQDDVHLRADA
jgi:hypothetical protein